MDKKCFLQFRNDETILNSKKVTFQDRIVALLSIWSKIADMDVFECTIGELVEIVEWAKLHSLNVILAAEWSTYSAENEMVLERNIERSKYQLAKAHTGFILPCERLIITMKNPWQELVLLKILKSIDRCTSEEIINFFCIETAYLTGVRLMKLCECRCEDMAMNLAVAFINSLYFSSETKKIIPTTHSQVWFIFDVYVSLLFKYNHRQKLFEILNGLITDEGYNLIKRMSIKNMKKRIWSHSYEIAKFACQIYITRIALIFSQDKEDKFQELISSYYELCRKSCTLFEFNDIMKRISDITNRLGLHKICYVLHNNYDETIRHLVIEIYIKTITTDINECENFKNATDFCQWESLTEDLADTFSKLSSIFDKNVEVARECVLTAFSLKPTEERLKMLEYMAERSGLLVDPLPNWKCPLHPPVLHSDEVMWLCSECGDWMTKPQLTRPLENNITLQQIFCAEVIGIPQILCDDLSVCISYSRYQILSWYQPWHELYRLCCMYLRDPAGTKNFITDLKYLDIDYSMFRHIKTEPIDLFAGIEKGYESCLNFDFDNDQKAIHCLENDTSTSSEKRVDETSAPNFKEFIIKLTPLHVTADFFLSPKVVLERNEAIQLMVNKKLQTCNTKENNMLKHEANVS